MKGEGSTPSRSRYRCEWCPRVFDSGYAYSSHRNTHAVVPTNTNPPQRRRGPPPQSRRLPLLLPGPTPPPPPQNQPLAFPAPHLRSRMAPLLLPPPPSPAFQASNAPALAIGNGSPRSSALTDLASSSSAPAGKEIASSGPQAMVSSPSKGKEPAADEVVEDNFKLKDLRDWPPVFCFHHVPDRPTNFINIDISTGREINLNKPYVEEEEPEPETKPNEEEADKEMKN